MTYRFPSSNLSISAPFFLLLSIALFSCVFPVIFHILIEFWGKLRQLKACHQRLHFTSSVLYTPPSPPSSQKLLGRLFYFLLRYYFFLLVCILLVLLCSMLTHQIIIPTAAPVKVAIFFFLFFLSIIQVSRHAHTLPALLKVNSEKKQGVKSVSLIRIYCCQ